MTQLASFLAAASRTPFAWGSHDCCLWIADWLRAKGYADPAAKFRGRYRTALGAHRLLKRHNGVLGFGLTTASLLRLPVTDEPVSGDVGVVEVIGLDGKRTRVGAICTGRRWAMLGRAGLLVSETHVHAAWRV